MIQSIYTSVSNADIVPSCNKGQKISSEPIPLLRNNYLGEYRTELEKAKVRKNLGIADNTVIEWGNITGYIEDNPDLREALSYKLPEHLEDIIKEEFSSVKGALSWAIEYLSTFVMDTESIAWLKEETANIRQSILEKEEQIYTQINSLSGNIQNNINNIVNIQNSIQSINENITKLNESLLSINVDANILNWIKNASSNSIELINDSKLEVKISEVENNAILVNEQGLFVQDLSEDVSTTKGNIENLQNDVQTLLDNYVSKEDLGGNNFNFVNQEEYNQHVQQASDKFSKIDTELSKTVKTGENGHVNTLFVNTISKDNNEENIIITDSFEVDSNIPLDIRFVRETLEDLYSLPVTVCYPGMGVIVNTLSSLYILRNPAKGVEFNQEYIKNPNSWKCPEDLVTIALSRQEYENLEKVNPYVFYYIYEDEITRTWEPKREEYLTEEEFQKEWQKWVDSLKTLSQQYMSASWGVDIENKLGKKASSQAVSLILAELELIKGNGNNPSLESLNNSVQELQAKDETFKERLDEILIKHEDIEQGRLVSAEKEINKVKKDLSNYVTKDYIQDSSNKFIFVKDEDYQNDQEELKESLSNQVITKEIVTDSLVLQETPITIKEERLNVNSKVIAEISDLPILEILTQTDYNEKEKSGEINEDTYYYTYDGDIRLVTNTDLIKESEKLQRQINVLFQGGTSDDIEGTLSTIFLPIETWNSFQEQYDKISNLALELEQRLIKIEPIKLIHSDDTVYITGDPERCYQEEDTIYINQTVYSDKITF